MDQWVNHVTGLTKLDNVVYASGYYAPSSIYKLDENTLKLLGVVSAERWKKNIRINGMVARTDDRKLYFCRDTYVDFMLVDDDSFGRWIDKYRIYFRGLSLTSRNSILAVTKYTTKLHEYSFSNGSEIAQMTMPSHVELILHAVRLSTGAYVVSYKGTPGDPEKYAVSKLSVFIVM